MEGAFLPRGDSFGISYENQAHALITSIHVEGQFLDINIDMYSCLLIAPWELIAPPLRVLEDANLSRESISSFDGGPQTSTLVCDTSSGLGIRDATTITP